jgi:metal-responsive CopG/Arc/MetJ family transcriptional regulator
MAKSTAAKKKGSVTDDGRRLISLWVPGPLVHTVDTTAKANDTDRSKWIREAMREKAARDGHAVA